jgi:hypothetical protein
LYQSHQPFQHDRRIWQKGVGVKLPLVCYVLELAPSGNSYYLVVERIALVQEMLEDLIHDGLLLFRNLDGYPLRDDNCDATTNDVVTGLLLACFSDQRVLEEGVEIDLIVENIGSETDSGVHRVFEEDILIIRCWSKLVRHILVAASTH